MRDFLSVSVSSVSCSLIGSTSSPLAASFSETAIKLLSRLVQVRDRLMKIISRGDAFRVLFGVLPVAIAAQHAWPGCQHLVARLHDRVIAVAFAALGPLMLVEGLLVFAAVEQAGVGRMANAAAPAYAGDAGWRGRVIPVAGVAARRAEIAAIEQGVAVNARAILRQLICRQRRAICAW